MFSHLSPLEKNEIRKKKHKKKCFNKVKKKLVLLVFSFFLASNFWSICERLLVHFAFTVYHNSRWNEASVKIPHMLGCVWKKQQNAPRQLFKWLPNLNQILLQQTCFSLKSNSIVSSNGNLRWLAGWLQYWLVHKSKLPATLQTVLAFGWW